MVDDLVYHQQTVSLLDPVPRVSSEALAALDERERVLGIRIPASVREWYSLEGAVTLLAMYSNDDNPVRLEDLGKPDWDWYAFQEHIKSHVVESEWDVSEPEWQGDALVGNPLVFMNENQACCRWAVPLEQADDPVVLAQNDAMLGWRKVSERFTSFVYSYIWNYSHIHDAACILEGDGLSLSLSNLAFLREHFREAPTTHLIPDYDMDRRYDHYRFVSRDGDARILIEDVVPERSVWHLATDSLLDLGHLATILRDLGAFTGKLNVRMRCQPGLDLSWSLYPDSSPGRPETLGQVIDRLGREGEAWRTVGRTDRRPNRVYACLPDNGSDVPISLTVPLQRNGTNAHLTQMTTFSRQRGNATDG